MNKIIQIKPVTEVFSITWNMGNRCNYDCMYCPPKFHSSTAPHKTLDELKRTWLGILNQTQTKNLKYKISVSGGEITGNRDFVPFLQWLREHYSDQLDIILLTTNGSATYKYYRKLFELVDNISFSVHSEHINEEKFFNCVVKLRTELPDNKHMHVNIMDEWWNQDRIELYREILSKHNISHNVNEIDYSYQTRTIPIMKGKLNLAVT